MLIQLLRPFQSHVVQRHSCPDERQVTSGDNNHNLLST